MIGRAPVCGRRKSKRVIGSGRLRCQIVQEDKSFRLVCFEPEYLPPEKIGNRKKMKIFEKIRFSWYFIAYHLDHEGPRKKPFGGYCRGHQARTYGGKIRTLAWTVSSGGAFKNGHGSVEWVTYLLRGRDGSKNKDFQKIFADSESSCQATFKNPGIWMLAQTWVFLTRSNKHALFLFIFEWFRFILVLRIVLETFFWFWIGRIEKVSAVDRLGRWTAWFSS